MAERKGLHFSVREATLSDALGILDCLKTAFEPYRSSYIPEALGDTALETVNDRLAAMTVFVATDDAGTVIGTVGGKIVDPTEGYLRGMAVRPEWQGCGVAEHLFYTVAAVPGLRLTRQNPCSVRDDFTKRMDTKARAGCSRSRECSYSNTSNGTRCGADDNEQ